MTTLARSVMIIVQEQYVIITDETLQRTPIGYNVLMQELDLIALNRCAVLR